MKDTDRILLGHGSGGRLTHTLLKDLIIRKLNNPILKELSDSAVIRCPGDSAFTTDSFVVSPLTFPGGDIGKLAVCGTVNDLVVQGAQPGYLSLAFIIEEGLERRILEEVVESVAREVRALGISVVTGDLKVVERGACDKLFINTSGIGRIITRKRLSVSAIRPKDRVVLTGTIGCHGLAVLSKRKGFDFGFHIESDCASLQGMLLPLLKTSAGIKFMRDPTRGGVATTLNEIVDSRSFGIIIDEKAIPISQEVRTASEMLGIDPLYIANEGRALIVVSPQQVQRVIRSLRRHPLGRNACDIGGVVESPRGNVVLETVLGTHRIIDMLTSEPLPRIC